MFSFLKLEIFRYTNIILFISGSFAFLTYILPLPILYGRGGWAGLMIHPMLAAPSLGVAILLTIYKFHFLKRFKLSKSRKYALFFSAGLIFLSLLLASSRAALLGSVSGILFFYFKYYQNRFGKFVKSLFILSFLILSSAPFWLDYTEGIQQKFEYAEDKGDALATRRANWESRILEFNSSPIFGIGFSNSTSQLNEDTGTIEPGSSWLAVLSQTGLLGALIVFGIFINSFLILLRDKENILVSATLGGILMLFLVHMFAEGYLLASGNYLFFYVWLLVAVIQIFNHQRNLVIV
ncbi:MAG: O-antigen ligase family protein [Bacteroidota bacterium]